MKKILVTMALMIAFILVLSFTALGAEYTATTEAELNDAVSKINTATEDATIYISGDLTGSSSYVEITSEKAMTVTINLTGDVEIDDSIYVTGYAHVIVNINGYTYTSTRNSGGATGSAFATNSDNATITVNGMDENGKMGNVISSDVTFYISLGTGESNNVNIITKSEETFYTGSQRGSCVIRVDGGKIENSSNSQIISFNNICIGSYFKNIELVANNKTLLFDSYASDKGWELLLENVTMDGFYIQSKTGKFMFIFKDVKGDFSASDVSLGQDSGGAGKMKFITSPTCQSEGTEVYYEKNVEGSVTTVLPMVDHTVGELLGTNYKNGFDSLGTYTHECSACKTGFELDTATAPAIFVPMGYTSNSDSTGFGTGFQINKDALLAYESINGTKITFGIVVFNPQYLNGETFVDGKINTTRGSVQSDMDTSYASCKLLVEGFTQSHANLELVFVGYAYEGENASEIQLMQKEYVSTEENPMASPMCSQINGLYTVKLATITAPGVVGNKESLDEFVKKTA